MCINFAPAGLPVVGLSVPIPRSPAEVIRSFSPAPFFIAHGVFVDGPNLVSLDLISI